MALILLVICQPIFARAYGGPDEDWANSVIQTPDGGFLVGGSTWGFGSAWIDMLLVKISPSGIIEWAKTLGGGGPDRLGELVLAPDGGFFVAGYTGSFGADEWDVLAAKLSASGELEWAKRLGLATSEVVSTAVACSDAGLILAGGEYMGEQGFDLTLLKLSAAGSRQWGMKLAGTGPDFAEGIAETDEGELVVVGWTMSWGEGYSDVLVASFSEGGALNWARTYGSPEHDAGFGIARAQDGGFVVIGETWGLGALRSDILVLKIDSAGGLTWARRYEGVGSERGLSITKSPDGGYLISGETSTLDVLMMRVSESGDLIWAKSFGGPEPDTLGMGILTAEGDLLVAGSTASVGAGLSDMFALRLPLDANYPGCLSEYPLIQVDITPAVNTVPDAVSAYFPWQWDAEPRINPQSPEWEDICPPEVEEASDNDNAMVIPVVIRGGVMFMSRVSTDIRIYSSDGRLVYLGKLEKGENNLSLRRGVYLWVAGRGSSASNPYKGRVVVR
ncbi:MAG: hypothetical protein ABIM46_01240 [candidate division WOR-3 bacterium]